MRAKVRYEPHKQYYRGCLLKQLRRHRWTRLADRVRHSQDSKRPKFSPLWRKENVSLTHMLWNAPWLRRYQRFPHSLAINFSSASPGSVATAPIWMQSTIKNHGHSDPRTKSFRCSADWAMLVRLPSIKRTIRKHPPKIATLYVSPTTKLEPFRESRSSSSLFTLILKFQISTFFTAQPVTISRNTRASAI